MNCSIKKLLSLLVVMAMVVSMIVPVNFSFVSAETSATTSVIPEAAQAAIAKAKTVKEKSEEVKSLFEGATGDVTAVCPVCGEEKTWTAVNNATDLGTSGISMGGGHYYLAEDIVNETYASGNNGFFMDSGCINLNGKDVTLSNGGRFLYIHGANTANVIDTAGGAVITGSYDALKYDNGYSATVRVNSASAVLNLYGGTYARMADIDTATENEIPTVGIRGGTLNLFDGATIVGADGTDGNKAIYGGALYVNKANSGTFNMYGGVIRDGKSTQAGNIHLKGVMNMYGGQIKNGVATGSDHCGGNMYITAGATFNMYGGEMLGGSAKYGGSIYMKSESATSFATMNMYGGFIAGGTSTKGVDYGHNVYLSTYGSGTSTTTSNVFNMAGGTLVGYLATSPNYGGSGSTKKHTATFSGTARLVPYGVDSEGNVYSATTTLSKVTFSSANMTAGGILFGSALDKGWGYCEDCGKVVSNGWTVVTTETEMTAGGHYIFLGSPLDYTIAAPGAYSALLKSKGDVCIDLNGADIKVHKGRFLTVDAAGTVNVRDSAGGATVSGSFDHFTGNGRVIQTTDGYESILNLYGGTYKGFVYEGEATNTSSKTKNATALIRVRNKATVNLYAGATVDGSSIEQKAAAVFVGNSANTASTFNLEGGTVIGTKNAGGDGDAVRLGNNANSATMNLNSGKIIGAGGVAINVRSSSTLNVDGGSITNEDGAGVNCHLTNTISVSGGEVSTLDVTAGSTLTLSGKPVIGMLYTNGVLANVDALTSEANITVSAGAGTILTAATNNDIGNAIKHADPENLLIQKNGDGQYVVVKNVDDPVEGKFDPENCGGLAYCPICGGAAVEWTSLQGDIDGFAMEAGKHYYLSDNTNVSGSITGSGCLNLNGFELKEAGSAKLIDALSEQVITVMDTKDADATGTGTTGKVIGKFAYKGQGGAAGVDGGTLNIYGGTYINNHTDGSAVGIRAANGGTINIHGGIIDGRIYDENGQLTVTQKTIIGAALVLNTSSVNGTVNMYDGLIIGGATSNRGGAVYLANSKATFNMYGGEIVAGQASNGNAISNNGENQVYVNLFGGKISLPEGAALTGHSINMIGNVRVVFGGVHPITEEALSPVVEGAVYIEGESPVVTLKNETKIDSLALNGNKATITDLAAGAEIGIVATYDVPFTGAYDGDVDMSTVFTTTLENAVLKQNDEGQFYYMKDVPADPDEFAPEDCEGWAYCPVCNEKVLWTAVSAPTKMEGGHYYLANNIDYNYNTPNDNNFLTGHGTINLNGKNVTINAGRFISTGAGVTNIVDTEGGSVVIGSNDRYANNGTTISVNNAEAVLHVRGGTFKGADDTLTDLPEGKTDEETTGSVVRVRIGTLHLYDGAVIDDEGYNKIGNYALFYIGNASGEQKCYIHGGSVLGSAKVADKGSLTLSGKPSIEKLDLGGKKAKVDELSAEADITVSAAANTILTEATTNEIGNAIKHSDPELLIKKNADDQYYVGYLNGVPCDHCGQDVVWTEITADSGPITSASGHIRFLEDVNYTYEKNGDNSYLTITGDAYIDLQGHTVTIDGGRFILMNGAAEATVVDTKTGAVVTGSGDYYAEGGVTIHVNHKDAVLNLYGGTYRGMNDTNNELDNKGNGEKKNTPVVRMRNGGTINLFEGATIDGLTNLDDRTVATVFMGYTNKTTGAYELSTFNLEGGTVIGGINSANNGGAFRVGSGVGTAVLNVKSGTIIGGTAAGGAAIQVRNGCTLNIEGGTIRHAEGGSGRLIGSYTENGVGTTMKISGGTVEGLVESSANSTITLSGTVVIGELDTKGNEANVAGLNAESSIVLKGYEGPVTEAYEGINNIVNVFTPAYNYRKVVKDNKIWLEIIDAKAVIEGVRYASVADALSDYKYANGKAIAFLETNVTIDEDILLDVAASAENLVISGSGTVYGFDTTNDTYETYKKIKVTGEVEVAPETTTANGYRYMSLFEDEYVGFHRFVTKLTAISLRTTKAGLYYKATYQCDALVRDRVVVYGVALSVTDMPGQDFLDESGNLFTMIENEFEGAYDAATHSVKTTSGSVFGILKAVGDNERTAEKNAEYLIMDIYANSYFTVDRDGNGDTYHYMADTKNAGKKRTDDGFTGVARNLLEVVNAMNKPEFIDKLSGNQKTNLKTMAAYWGQHLTDDGKIAWEAATSLMK